MTNDAGGDAAPDKKWADQLVAIAAAIASSIGVLGFVTFAGGVVMWERFNKMGLPADQAVALMPKSVLITTGAHFLVPALLATGAIVLAIVPLRLLRERREERSKATGQPASEDAGRSRVRRLIRTLTASVVLGCALFAGEAYAAFAGFAHHGYALVVLLAIAAGGAFALWLVLHRQYSTAAVALVAFPTVGAFWIARTLEHTSYFPRVLPMAYSRAERGSTARVEIGYLIAETSDRIWFASLPRPTGGTPNELREFPRQETDDLEIGPLTDMSAGKAEADRFANNLCIRLWYEQRLAAGGCPPHPRLAEARG